MQIARLPRDWNESESLEEAGRSYNNVRADIMVRNQRRLTDSYHRTHNPQEKSSEIAHLREHHAAMDRPVLEAHGWDGLPAASFCRTTTKRSRGWGGSGIGESRNPNPDGENRIVSTGPTTSATKSSPACSNSSNNATEKTSSRAKPPQAERISNHSQNLIQRRNNPTLRKALLPT